MNCISLFAAYPRIYGTTYCIVYRIYIARIGYSWFFYSHFFMRWKPSASGIYAMHFVSVRCVYYLTKGLFKNKSESGHPFAVSWRWWWWWWWRCSEVVPSEYVCGRVVVYMSKGKQSADCILMMWIYFVLHSLHYCTRPEVERSIYAFSYKMLAYIPFPPRSLTIRIQCYFFLILWQYSVN